MLLTRTPRLFPSTASCCKFSQFSKQIPRQVPRFTRSPYIIINNSSNQTRMASTQTRQKLNTGAEIPAVGFGTWQDPEAQANAVAECLRAGYRHIDGARVYGTEPMIKQGIKDSGVPRSEIFITTKLWNNAHHPDDVEKALDASLSDLGTDYIDLYLMHWPSAFARSSELFPKDGEGKLKPDQSIDYVDTWKAMEQLYKKGKAKAIGISNFSKAELERLLKETSVVPADHQLELHPYLQQPSFHSFHQSKGIHITQYSPFGNSNPIYDKGQSLPQLIQDPVLQKIGEKYGKNGAQVALAWGINSGHAVIPKSKTPSRIKSNFEGDFKLSSEDMTEISKLDKKLRFNDPSNGFGHNFFADLDGKA